MVKDVFDPTPHEMVSPHESGFPLPLRHWMSQFVSSPLMKETRADCDDCPMVTDTALSGAIHFTSKARCCNYIPKLSNFQVGAICLDVHPSLTTGRSLIDQRISSRRGVSPLGIYPNKSEKRAYQTLFDQDKFGQSDDFICPYQVADSANHCSIWKYRSSVCSTWFCRHVRGAPSKDYWRKLGRLLETAEQTLSSQCLVALDISPTALTRLFPPRREDAATDFESDDLYGEIWGSWIGREKTFYQACAEYVKELRWDDITKIAGPELTIRLKQFADAEQFLANGTVPTRLAPGRFHASGNAEMTQVLSYLRTDIIEVPTQLMMLLHRFDGRELAEILKEIKHQDRIELDEKTIMTLCDFRILTPKTDR